MKKYLSIVLILLLTASILFNLYQHREYNRIAKNIEILSYELDRFSQKNERLIEAITDLVLEEDEIANLVRDGNEDEFLDSLLLKIKNINTSIQRKSDSLLTMNEMFRKFKNITSKPDQTLRQSLEQAEELKEMLSIKTVELDLLRSEIDQLKRKIQQADNKVKEITISLPENIKLRYIGELENNKPEGLGVGFYSTGGYYIGQWKDGVRHGQGEYFWSSGDSYKGEFYQDKRHGEGVYVYSNGYRYKGSWRNDLREGYGELLDEENRVQAKGIWKNNKLLNKQ